MSEGNCRLLDVLNKDTSLLGPSKTITNDEIDSLLKSGVSVIFIGNEFSRLHEMIGVLSVKIDFIQIHKICVDAWANLSVLLTLQCSL